MSPDLCAKRAKDLYSEYKNANETGHQDRVRSRNAKGIPPEQQVIKVNVDATVNIQEDKIGFGMVARDSNRKVLFAASETTWPFSTVELAELTAFSWAIDLIYDNG